MKTLTIYIIALVVILATVSTNVSAQGWEVSNQTPGITYANCALTDSIAYSGVYSAKFECQGTSTADTVWFTKHYRPFKFNFNRLILQQTAEVGNWEGKWTILLHHYDTTIIANEKTWVYYGTGWGSLSFTWNGILDSVDAITVKCWYTNSSTNFSRQTMWLDHFTLDGILLDDCGDGCTITGNVFADLNANGSKDEDESNIPNWVIKAHWAENPDYYDSVATDEAGEFIFRNLVQSSYFLTQEINNCWIPTTKDTIWLSFDPLHTDTVITFGNWGVNASSFTFRERWNLVSLPRQSCERQVEKLFPDALSGLWQYAVDHYTPSGEFETGTGYWLKLPTNTSPKLFVGELVTAETLAIHEGWNLVGVLSQPLLASQAITEPEGLLASHFFGYDGGYMEVDTLLPARGYWIKSAGEGYLILDINASIGKTAFAKVISSELPPPPPDGDIVPSSSPLVPDKFSLMQNYPNPFNPVTVIAYAIPNHESGIMNYELVTLKVFNMLGQEVAILVNEMQTPGSYSVQWNAGNNPSGMYFYRLTSGNHCATGKMMYLK